MQAVYGNPVLAQGPGTVQDKPVLTQGNSAVRNAPVLDQAVQAPFYPTPDGTLPQQPQQPQQKPGFGDRLMRYMAAQEARGETPVSQKLIAMGAARAGSPGIQAGLIVLDQPKDPARKRQLWPPASRRVSTRHRRPDHTN